MTATMAALEPLFAPRGVAVIGASRDPGKLGAYVHFFGASFQGLTGTPSAIAQAAAAFGVPYRREPESDGGYTVDHSAAIYLIDPDARLCAVFMPPQQTALVASDYRAIVAARGR